MTLKFLLACLSSVRCHFSIDIQCDLRSMFHVLNHYQIRSYYLEQYHGKRITLKKYETQTFWSFWILEQYELQKSLPGTINECLLLQNYSSWLKHFSRRRLEEPQAFQLHTSSLFFGNLRTITTAQQKE